MDQERSVTGQRLRHRQLVCRACGWTEDVEHVVGVAPRPRPEEAAGYAVDEVQVVFWGLCPDCRRHGGHTFE